MKLLDSVFKIKANETTVSRELLAGFTTWVTMVYIVVVNPLMLSGDGKMDHGSVFVATCLAAAFGSMLMGALANLPVALAPGMGLNAFFVYSVIVGMGYTWQAALGAVFWSGVIFFLLSTLKIRQAIVNSLPDSLKTGTAIGIGFFLAIIGLQNGGIIEKGSSVLLQLGNMHSYGPVLTGFGLILIIALHSKGKNWAVIAGIIAVSSAGWIFDASTKIDIGSLVSEPPSVGPTFLKFDLLVPWDALFITVVLSLVFVDLFDTSGTLIAVARAGNLETPSGDIPRVGRAMVSDSLATVVGSVLGTSTTTSYIESNAGIAAGGRTGLTAITTGFLFVCTLFVFPLASAVPIYATAPALIFVAVLLIGTLSSFKSWSDFSESGPLVVTAMVMPLTLSIADGLAAGCLVYVGSKILSFRVKEIPPALAFLSVIFLCKFIYFP